MARPRSPRPIDALAPGPPGRYEDDVVVVRRRPRKPLQRPRSASHTPHFEVWTEDGRLVVEHTITPRQLDDDLTGLLADELFRPGWVSGADVFERVFTGVVRSMDDDPLHCWELFYRNTLGRLEMLSAQAARPASGHGSLAEYSPVYARAQELVAGSTVLGLDSCFGFLALRLVGSGLSVTASDVSAGTVSLLGALSERLRLPLRTLVADAARVPLPDGHVDTVLAVHLLEHLDADDGRAVLAESLRLASRRVVVAVPLEESPTTAFGHLRSITLDDLAGWGAASGWPATVHEHHGGWLVLERPTTAGGAG